MANNEEKVKAEYTYGATGQATEVKNKTSAICTKYDNKGLIGQQKVYEENKSYVITYANDGNGKCNEYELFDSSDGYFSDYTRKEKVMYKYDAKGNLYTVTDVTTGSDKLMAKYSYDANDNLSSVTYGNGTSTIYTYNNGNMIQTVSNIGADNRNMSYYSYDYYLDGNVSQQNRNGVNCYYDYDEFSRITDEDYGREEIDYYYDAAGNRTLKTICDDNGDTEVDYAYDLNNRLLEESNHSYANNKTDVTKYVYDNNGNQIKKIGYTTKGVNGSPSQDLVSENELNNTYEMYKYNEFNEMTSFESNKEAVWYYAYLPNGLRYRKHKNNYNNSDWFVWDRNGNIIAEMNNNKEYTNKYVRGNKLISKNDNEYYSYDGHGSVVNISNEDGKSIKTYDYDAFGVELNRDVNDTNLFRYCGEQYDNETDSIYLRARYYNPSLGRFTTEDTYWNSSNRIYGDKEYKEGEIKYPDYKAIIQSENLYIYCINNPTCYLDITGLNPEKKYIDSRNKSETYYTYYDKDDDTIYKPSFNTTTTLMIPTDDKSAAEATDYVLACYESTKLGEKIVGEIISGKIVGILSEEIPTIDIFAALDQSHESTVLVDDAGRYFNVEIGDKVYVTTASWSYKGICYTARAVEYRVKIIRNGEVMYNNTYFESM